MSFWDNVKKFAKPYAEDDEYDEYDDEEGTGDYAEDAEEPASRFGRRSGGDTSARDDGGFDFGADDPFGSSPATPAASAAAPTSGGFSGQVVNMNSGRQQVVVFCATQFADSTRAMDELRSKKAVIVNMENVDKAIARRVVDVLSGCVYALDGKITKVAQNTYLFSPHNMEVTGDVLENLQSEVDSYI